jgi:hypothetical protein
MFSSLLSDAASPEGQLLPTRRLRDGLDCSRHSRRWHAGLAGMIAANDRVVKFDKTGKHLSRQK